MSSPRIVQGDVAVEVVASDALPQALTSATEVRYGENRTAAVVVT